MTALMHHDAPIEDGDDITIAAGDKAAVNAMIARLYGELRGIARRNLGRSRRHMTLGTTALVNETCLRLLLSASNGAQNRAHFLNLAAKVMRQLVCDFARKHLRELNHIDRGGVSDEERERIAADEKDALRLAAVDSALDELAAHNERWVRVVECRYFLGLTTIETAETLALSVRTVERCWTDARAWLAQRLDGA
jgi:RNA polymerase sigma factor (TIGR02999 family)